MNDTILQAQIDQLKSDLDLLRRDIENPLSPVNTTGELLTTAQVCTLLRIHKNSWFRWLKKYPKPPQPLGRPGSFTWRKTRVINFATRMGKLKCQRDSEKYYDS